MKFTSFLIIILSDFSHNKLRVPQSSSPDKNSGLREVAYETSCGRTVFLEVKTKC